MVCVITILASGIAYVIVSASPDTITIKAESFVSEANYIIFKQGSTYYAYQNGSQRFSGTNAGQVINNAINSLTETDNGSVVIQGGCGTYVISTKILIEGFQNFELIGVGYPRLQSNSGFSDYTIEVKDISTYGNVRVSGLFIDGVDKTRGGGIKLNSAGWVEIDHCFIKNVQNPCIWTTGSGGGTSKFCHNYLIGSAAELMKMDGGADSHIEDNYMGYGTKGILLAQSRYIIRSNHIWEVVDGIVLNSNFNQVFGNVIEKITGNGIIINGNKNNVYGNQIAEEGGVKPTIGINLTGANAIINTVSGNIIVGCSQYGIRGELNANSNVITYNHLTDNTVDLSVLGSYNIIKHNYGYTTENTVTFSSISNGTYVSHGLAGTPQTVVVTLTVQGYAWAGTKNSTHVQLYFSLGTASGSMYAEYKP